MGQKAHTKITVEFYLHQVQECPAPTNGTRNPKRINNSQLIAKIILYISDSQSHKQMHTTEPSIQTTGLTGEIADVRTVNTQVNIAQVGMQNNSSVLLDSISSLLYFHYLYCLIFHLFTLQKLLILVPNCYNLIAVFHFT